MITDDAQDGAGEAALVVVAVELELLPHPPSEAAPELELLPRGGGVHDELLEDAMTGRAEKMQKKHLRATRHACAVIMSRVS